MPDYLDDPIVAIATPPGTGGIHVLRVSGENCISIVNKYLSKDIKKRHANTVTFCDFIDNNIILDQVLCTIFKTPHSYTGEDVVEISCHGSQFIADRILQALLRDVRLANPGEFTLRAYLNNKLDLTQAEAVNDLINSQTVKSHDLAMKQLEGSLFHKIEELLDKLIAYRMQVELEIDFLEDDNPEIDMSALKAKLIVYINELKQLADTGENGRILRDGLKVCLIGAPNAGKSSLFNQFLECERAIVTPTPGTTRDYLEEVVSIQGYLVKFFDTAGIRETSDDIEKLGIQRSLDIIDKADKVVYVHDITQPSISPSAYIENIDNDKIIKVLNKVDNSDAIIPSEYQDYIICSALSSDGIGNLEKELLEQLKVSESESVLLTNRRQVNAVLHAIKSMEKAVESIDAELGYEFTAFDLKEASQHLEEVIGKISNDDILNKIFDNFCIGK